VIEPKLSEFDKLLEQPAATEAAATREPVAV
jgi:hypothetical protein